MRSLHLLLALAEATALSEWREKEEAAGTLSHRNLVRRAEEIEQQLLQRQCTNIDYMYETETTLGQLGAEADSIDEWIKTHLMAEVYYAAVRLLIATIVNGPFPRGECFIRCIPCQADDSARSS